jgi:capsular exopolysaccharide synthesis family protein
MEMASALRKRWRVIVVSILIVIAGVAAYVNLVTPSYSASAKLYVSSPADSTSVDVNAANAYLKGLAVQQRMSSYVQIASSYQVLAPVVKKLGLPYGWEHLRSKVSVSNPTTTVLLDVSASDSNADQAARLANAVAGRMSTYIRTLEGSATSQSPITATVFQPAFAPSSPSSPRTTLYLIAAALIGAAVGIALALVRDSLDASIKSTEEVADQFNAVALGSVPYDRETSKRPIAVSSGRGPGRAEAFRQIRTNLQFAQIDEQPRSILVTSAVAEEGKTMVACNIAVTLAQLGVDVVLLEGDLRRPRVAEYMGVERAVGLTSVLMGWTHWSEALQDWGGDDVRLRVLASGPTPPNPSEMLAGEAMDRLMTELEDQCDVVIIDGPPLLPVADSAVLAASASGTIVVVRQGRTKRQQIERALAALDAVDARLYGLVLNMARKDSVGIGSYGEYLDPAVLFASPRSADGSVLPDEQPDGTGGKPPRFRRQKASARDGGD